MKRAESFPLRISEMSDKLNGVFTRPDLAHLFGANNEDTLSKRIESMISGGYLKRAIKGIYYTPNAKLMDVAQRIYFEGYFSTSTALSFHTMIGTRPAYKVSILTTRPRNREIRLDIGTIQMKKIHRDYFFGFQQQGTIKVATPEKALIDTCYYYMRKEMYPFNLSCDINVWKIDLDLLGKMLERYKNKKFVQFTLNMIEANGREIR